MQIGGSLANGAANPSEAADSAKRKDKPTHKFSRSLPESQSV
jgi:hypothetical protein